ncbi:MAG: imelysin family protein [Pseudomonadota bacterium]
MKHPRIAIGTISALSLGLMTATAIAQSTPDDDAYAAFNRAIIEHQIAPAHGAFAVASRDLAAALDGYCAAGTDDLDAVSEAYHDTYDGWMAVSWVNFGPQSLFMRPVRVHFWPDSRNTVGRQLAGVLNEPRDDLLDPQVLASASVALQGLPALERLLFESDGLEANAYTCGLAVAIAANLAAIAEDLSAAWSDPEASAAALPDDQALAVTMFQAVYEQLELILTRKLAGPLGENADRARPRLAENWRSGRALRNIAINLTALRNVIENDEQTGLADLLRETPSGADAADRLVEELDAAIERARSVQDQPIAQLVQDPELRPDLVALGRHVAEARRIWADEVGPALNLNLGFNSLDGD